MREKIKDIISSPVKYLLYIILFVYPFLPITLGHKLNIGSENIMNLILIPFGLICFTAWILTGKAPSYIVWIAGILVLYLSFNNRGTIDEYARLLALFGIVLWLSNSKVDYNIIALIITISAILACMASWNMHVYGTWTHVRHQHGMRGIIGTDNLLAMYLLVCIPFVFKTMEKNKTIGVVAILLLVYCLLFTRSRAGLVLMFEEIILCVFIFSKTKPNWKFISAIIILIVAMAYVLMTNEKIDFHGVSVFGRDQFAQYTKDMFLKNPIFGVGAGKWGEVAHSIGLKGEWYHPHNEFAICLAEYGIIGLILVTAFYCISLIKAIKYLPYVAVGLGTMLIHSFVAGMRAPVQVLYLGLMMGLVSQKEIIVKDCGNKNSNIIENSGSTFKNLKKKRVKKTAQELSNKRV